MSNKILFFLKVPPPTTGATLMNERVINNEYLKKRFNIRSIPISYAESVADIGKNKAYKISIFIKNGFKLFYELAFHKPDLVYFQISPLGLPFLRDSLYVLLMKCFNVKILFHLRAKGIKDEIDSIWKKKLYKLVFKSEEIICLSRLVMDDIENVHSGPVHIVSNGIPDYTQKINGINKLNNQDVNILFLSNLLVAKGILDFLDALKIIKESNIPFKGIIIGGESDLTSRELNEEIKTRKLDENVKYLGPKYEIEKHDYIESSDILVFPTKMKWETFGNINLEAMMHSKPIIATNIAAIPEIIDDGISGFIVNPNSPLEIADRLKLLIEDPQKRLEFGKEGRKKYESYYTLDHFQRRMNDVFSKILNN